MEREKESERVKSFIAIIWGIPRFKEIALGSQPETTKRHKGSQIRKRLRKFPLIALSASFAFGANEKMEEWVIKVQGSLRLFSRRPGDDCLLAPNCFISLATRTNELRYFLLSQCEDCLMTFMRP